MGGLYPQFYSILIHSPLLVTLRKRVIYSSGLPGGRVLGSAGSGWQSVERRNHMPLISFLLVPTVSSHGWSKPYAQREAAHIL